MMTMLMANGNISGESVEKINDIMRKMLDLLESFFCKDVKVNLNHRLLSHALLAFLNGLLVNYRKLPGRSEEEVTLHMKSVGGIVADIISILNGKNK